MPDLPRMNSAPFSHAITGAKRGYFDLTWILFLIQMAVTVVVGCYFWSQLKKERQAQPGQTDDGYDNEETQTDSQGNTIAVKKDYTLLSDYMKMKGIDITYKDSVIGDEYPNDGSALFVVEAEPGKKLVAVEYFLTNNTDADITYSVSQDTPVFSLKVDSSKSVMSFKTLLLNDFSNMKDFELAAGETKTAVIVFQIDADDAEALSKIQVRYGNGGSSLPTEPR